MKVCKNFRRPNSQPSSKRVNQRGGCVFKRLKTPKIELEYLANT
jgi:hypothetical protein